MGSDSSGGGRKKEDPAIGCATLKDSLMRKQTMPCDLCRLNDHDGVDMCGCGTRAR